MFIFSKNFFLDKTYQNITIKAIKTDKTYLYTEKILFKTPNKPQIL